MGARTFRAPREESPLMDLAVLLVVAAFFLLTGAFVGLCQKV